MAKKKNRQTNLLKHYTEFSEHYINQCVDYVVHEGHWILINLNYHFSVIFNKTSKKVYRNGLTLKGIRRIWHCLAHGTDSLYSNIELE